MKSWKPPARASISPVRCGTEPACAAAKFNVPGLALPSLARSATERMADVPGTTTIMGLVPTAATGTMSRSTSYCGCL